MAEALLRMESIDNAGRRIRVTCEHQETAVELPSVAPEHLPLWRVFALMRHEDAARCGCAAETWRRSTGGAGAPLAQLATAVLEGLRARGYDV